MNPEVDSFFSEVNKSVNALGAEKVVDILRIYRNNEIVITDEQQKKADTIIRIVCQEFNVSQADFNSTNKKIERRYAIGACTFFIAKILSLDNLSISYMLKKPQQLTSKYRNDIASLDSTHPSDKKIVEKIQNITEKLKTSHD